MIKNQHKIFLFVVLIACSSVVFRNLDSLSVRMWDESRNAINAMEMVKSGNPLVVMYEGEPDLWNTKPPFLTWNIAFFMKIIGVNELAVRLPSAFAALISMIVVFLTLYKVSESNIMSCIGSVALATFPGFIDYHVARNGDFDSMLTMWVFLAGCTFYFWISNTENNSKLVYLTALCLLGGVLTKGIAALIIVPGFMLFAILSGRIKRLFTTKAVYIAIILAVVPLVGFYMVREFYSPGYVKAVIENELTGRYLNVTEEHAADSFYYFRNLVESHLGVWKYVVLISLVTGLIWGRKKPSGNIILFGLISAASYLIVISTAKTKLPWYDAVAFPFIALICGGGVILLFEKLKSSLFKPGLKYQEWMGIVLVVLLAAYPLSRVHSKTSVRATTEQTYPELFYGNMIRSYFHSRPADSLSVVYDGYNSHALFYVRSYEMKHFNVKAKTTSSKFYPGEVVLTCEDPFYQVLRKRYRLETIFENNSRVVSRIVERLENPELDSEEQALELLQQQIDEIMAIPDWKSGIEKKARENGVSFEAQVRLDAIYVLGQNKKITVTQAQFLNTQPK